jgi:hypothetical protein
MLYVKGHVKIPSHDAEEDRGFLRNRPGDEIDWVAAGEVIRVILPGARAVALDRESKLRLFDQATKRQRTRPVALQQSQPSDKGWSREDLYCRGRSH